MLDAFEQRVVRLCWRWREQKRAALVGGSFLGARTSMAHEGPPINWTSFHEAGEDGRLLELLVKLPRERWAERDGYGTTLLHYACRGPHVAAVVALLQSGLMDVNAWDLEGATPTLWAASCKQPRVLELLCAAGADLRASNAVGLAPIECTLFKDGVESGCVLLANGVRLSTVRKDRRHLITPELRAFERGVLCCRAAVVAILRVKRAGQLWMWDKFLLLEIALCIWSTRYDKGWQTAMQQQQEPAHAMLPPQ